MAANKTSLEDAAGITGLNPADIVKAAEWIAMPKDGGARRRTMFAYEKGLIWGNDNYRTNAALVNIALATGNIGRPGGGCVRMGGHQEGYVRPSDGFIGRPAPYVDKLLIEGKGGVHHIWACDHYKTTLNAIEFKRVYKQRTDKVKDAMLSVAYGDRQGMVDAIVAAIKDGGLFAVDVDIIPTKIGEAAPCLAARRDLGRDEPHLDERRAAHAAHRALHGPARPVDAGLPDRGADRQCTWSAIFREQGKNEMADKFKGFDWKTEEDAFMDGYHKNAGGGEFVTYDRLRAMGTNGFQEPATGFEDGKIVGTKRLYTDGKFGGKDGKATFFETQWRGLQAPGKQEEKDNWPFLINNGRTNHRLAERLSRPGERAGHGPLALSLHRDEPGRHDASSASPRAISSRSTTTTARPRRWSIRRRRRSRRRPSCSSPIRRASRATSSRRA